MYKVRIARKDDILWLGKQGYLFTQFSPTKFKLFDLPHLVELFFNLIENHILLVCEKGGIVVAALGGVIAPHYFNPKFLVASEVFWWVEEEYRGGRSGLLLLNAYIKEAKDLGVHAVSMSRLEISPFNESILLKKGFKLLEKSYLLEF